MSVDYAQLKTFVKEAMFTGGGINEPSAPEGVPHRMPAADRDTKEQDRGDPKANELYDLALAAREATEVLVEALDEVIYDGAYEHAFKASACLRRALNELETTGAHPMPVQRVVSPPAYQQKYTAGSSGAGSYSSFGPGYSAGGMMGEGAGDIPAAIAAAVEAHEAAQAEVAALSDDDREKFNAYVSGDQELPGEAKS